MVKKLICIIVSMLLFATMISVAGDTNNNEKDSETVSLTVDNWSMQGHDAARTCYTTSTGPETNNLLFRTDIAGSGIWGMSAAEGKVYISSFTRHLYCINAYTGDIIFDNEQTAVIASAPAINDGRIYYGSYDNFFYCVDATTGSEIWSYDAGGAIYDSPALYDDKLYFGTQSGEMICVDLNGDEVWTYSAGGNAYTPAVSDGKVYFGSYDDNVYCLNASDGSYIWDYDTNGDIKSTVCVEDEKVYAISASNNAYCLDGQDGSVIWSKSMTFAYSQPGVAIHDGKFFVPSSDEKFYCLNSNTGEEIWNVTPSPTKYSQCTPVIADGKVYLGDRSNDIFCFDESDGSEIWNYTELNYDYQSCPAIYNSILYIVTRNHLNAFGTLENEAPETPEMPEGPTEGEIDIEYTYSTSTTDTDGDQVYYMWDFGDEVTDWIGPFDSGVQTLQGHTWTSPEDYDVKVKAKDIYDAESDWSDVLEVTIVELFPELSIESITGGLGVTTIISNIGDANATNVTYTLTVTGGILNLINVTVTGKTHINNGLGIKIDTGIFFGLGPIEINVTAECDEGSSDEETADGMQIIFFSIVS